MRLLRTFRLFFSDCSDCHYQAGPRTLREISFHTSDLFIIRLVSLLLIKKPRSFNQYGLSTPCFTCTRTTTFPWTFTCDTEKIIRGVETLLIEIADPLLNAEQI